MQNNIKFLTAFFIFLNSTMKLKIKGKSKKVQKKRHQYIIHIFIKL